MASSEGNTESTDARLYERVIRQNKVSIENPIKLCYDTLKPANRLSQAKRLIGWSG